MKNKRKKYVIMKLLLMFLGYISVGVIITTLLITIFGSGSALTGGLLCLAILIVIVSFTVEQHYQRKIDEIDYDNLPF